MNSREASSKIKLTAEASTHGDNQETSMKASGSWVREAVRELGKVGEESTMKEIGLPTKLMVMV